MSIQFLQRTGSGTDGTSFSFTSQNFAAAHANRYIIVTIAARNLTGGTINISSVTIGGVSASIAVQQNNTTDGNVVGIAIAAVPSGTTGDIVVTLDATATYCDINVYKALGVSSTTPTDSGGSTGNTPSTSLDINANGIAVGVAISDDGSQTATWAGLTEDFDGQTANSGDITGASLISTAGASGLSVSVTWSGTPSRPVACFASFNITGFSPSVPTPDVLSLTFSVLFPFIINVAKVIVSALTPTVTIATPDWTNEDKVADDGSIVNESKT